MDENGCATPHNPREPNMNTEKNPNKIVVFTGAGISQESGLPTFRDMGGIWNTFSIEDVASPEAWAKHPQRVLDFYNERRHKSLEAEPNEAHRAIQSLEEHFDVVVVTQNVDDLHERAGSSQVIHLHGLLRNARSSNDPALVYDFGNRPIHIGDLCAKGSQLRPDIVWFGEAIQNFNPALYHLFTSRRVLVVGTSLSVEPAASLLSFANSSAEKVVVSMDLAQEPEGYQWIKGKATEVIPRIAVQWSR